MSLMECLLDNSDPMMPRKNEGFRLNFFDLELTVRSPLFLTVSTPPLTNFSEKINNNKGGWICV